MQLLYKIDILNEIKTLTETNGKTFVSIYIPTSKRFTETDKDKIKLKNLYGETLKLLEKAEYTSTNAKNLMAPLKALQKDQDFWKYLDHGLAIFATEDYFKYYTVPTAFDQNVYVQNQFNIKPLFSMLLTNNSYYVLALSPKHVRLFKAVNQDFIEIKLSDMPKNIDEALGADEGESPNINFSSATGKSARAGGDYSFHGHGDDKAFVKDQWTKYCRIIDKHIGEMLSEEKYPLFLACTDSIFNLYKEINTYSEFDSETYVSGNFDDTNEKDLFEKASETVLKRIENINKEIFNSVNAKDTVNTIDNIVRLSYQGRLSMIFIDPNTEIFGLYNEEHNQVLVDQKRTKRNYDLVNYAIINTIQSGGTVHGKKDTLLGVLRF